MAIHRYWRLVGFATLGNTALELSEARIYEGGVLADAAATLTATIAPDSGVLADLRDGVATGIVSWPYTIYSAPGFALRWDFGVGLGVDQAQLRLGSGSSEANFAADLTLQYSDDSASWTIFDRLVGIAWTGASTQIYLPADHTQADANFDKTVLLLRFDPDTGLQDLSLSPKTITNYLSMPISAADSVTGEASLYFAGNLSRLYIEGLPAFGTNDFCIEKIIRFSNATAIQFIFDARPPGTNGAYPSLYINGAAIEYYANSAIQITGAHGLANNDLAHIGVSRVSGVIRVFVKGAQVGASKADTINYLPSTMVLGISAYDGLSYPMVGYVDSMRIKVGEAIYPAAFTAPTYFSSRLSSAAASVTHLARANGTAPSLDLMLPAIALADPTAQIHLREITFFDISSGPSVVPAGGAIFNTMTGSITGTVKNTPATPVSRRVLLMDQRSQLVVRETWSDPVTGAYAFNGLNTATEYAVISYDHTRTYRAVIADYITPDPLP